MEKIQKLGLIFVLSFASVGFAQERVPSSKGQLVAEDSLQKEIDASTTPLYMPPATNTNYIRQQAVVHKEPSLIQLEPLVGYAFSTYTSSGGNNNNNTNPYNGIYNGTATNVGTYSFSTTSGISSGVGILVGRGNLQLESGLIYAERGGKESYQYGITSWDINFQNHYLEVPLMARYSFSPSRETKVFFKGGVIVAMLQDSSGSVENNQNYTSNGYSTSNYNPYSYNGFGQAVNSTNTKNDFTSVDPRWSLGVGGKVRITSWISWMLEADYQSSINPTSTTQPNGYYGTTNMSLTMSSYGITTGLSFNL